MAPSRNSSRPAQRALLLLLLVGAAAAQKAGVSNVDPKLGLVANGENRSPVTGNIAAFEQQLVGGGRRPIPGKGFGGGGGGFGGAGGNFGGGGGNFGGVGGTHGGFEQGGTGGGGFGGVGGTFNYKHCPDGSRCCCLPQATCDSALHGGDGGEGFELDLRIINRPPAGISCQGGSVYCCSGDGDLSGGLGGIGGGGLPGKDPYPPGVCGVQRNFYYRAPEHGQADYGEYPWQVLILDQSDGFVGGGVLINNGHVLTATHKIYDWYAGNRAHELKIRVGDWDVAGENPNEKFPIQERQIARILIQDGFNKATVFNDLAILYLARPIEYSPVVSPICLPSFETRTFERQICWTTGWGKDAFDQSGQFSTVLKEVDVPILAPQACQNLLGAVLSRPGHRYRFNPIQHICAGGQEGKDACYGDGGSALVCQSLLDKKFYLAGIVAFGVGCGRQDVPGGYVNVLSFNEWIRRNTGYVDGPHGK